MDRRLRTPPQRPLVLIVDGHEEVLALYAVALYAMGFDVLPARGAAEAYNRARHLQPDIIAAILPMPADEVWELLRQLKQDVRTHDIPVVAVGGPIPQSLRERAEWEGFAAVLPRPSVVEELAVGLRQVINRKIRASA